MHFKHALKIAVPAHIAFATMRDELDKVAVDLPNIVNMTILERKESGGKTYISSKWQGKFILPDIIGQIIKVPDMAWVDRAEWHNDTYKCNWSYEPFIFKDYIRVYGTDVYAEDGKHTTITVKGEVSVNFLHYPLIPTMLKKKMNEQVTAILLSHMEPNFITLYSRLEKYIKAKYPNL